MRYLLLFFIFFTAIVSRAQSSKSFEGEIHFKLDISGGGDETELARQFMPSGFVYILKGNNVLIKTIGANAGMTGNVVYNAKTDRAFLVQDASKTVYLIQDKALDEEGGEDVRQLPRIEQGSQSKTIAGFLCKHYIIYSGEEEGGRTEIWVTDAIQVTMPKSLGNNMPIEQKIMSVVKGFPLALKMESPGGLLMAMEAEKVEKKIVSSSLFDLPKGYETKIFQAMPALPGGVE